ncbi:hypothetical protein [Streptomyces sp. WM6378]|uniref:hypothetical protein n=1 Tax=Streptomyces sp. WM6378 TaxID=1415557 RepID=UPI0006AE71EF|nr:hypothetical protein [Streptomyces sp. WM6378]KOU43585.1 hypothetical protein ADK54_17480 [Streptomyces sp. WM6378]
MSSTPAAPGLLHGIRNALVAAGVRQVPDAETWGDARDEVLVKAALAPTAARISARGGEFGF